MQSSDGRIPVGSGSDGGVGYWIVADADYQRHQEAYAFLLHLRLVLDPDPSGQRDLIRGVQGARPGPRRSGSQLVPVGMRD